MWSHYADAHSGVCLEFKLEYKFDSLGIFFEKNSIADTFAEFGNGFLPVKKVLYPVDNAMPEAINWLKEDDKTKYKFYEFLLTKAKDWEYEKEWRIVAPIPEIIKKKPVKFLKDSLSSIIFGAKTTIDDMQIIKNIIDTHYDDKVDFYQSLFVPEKYELSINKIYDLKKNID